VRVDEVDVQTGVFFDAFMVEHLVALVPSQRPSQPDREFGERADECVTDRLRRMISRHRNQNREPELALDQRCDPRALSGAEQQVVLRKTEALAWEGRVWLRSPCVMSLIGNVRPAFLGRLGC
jgi:hypothetical protein